MSYLDGEVPQKTKKPFVFPKKPHPNFPTTFKLKDHGKRFCLKETYEKGSVEIDPSNFDQATLVIKDNWGNEMRRVTVTRQQVINQRVGEKPDNALGKKERCQNKFPIPKEWQEAFSASPMPDEIKERWRAQVRENPENGCWDWMGPRCNGYGIFEHRDNPGRRQQLAHRVSLKIFKDGVADDLLACHTCDRPECVNPFHLYAGTNADNSRDASVRGRLVNPGGVNRNRGEFNGMSKLTREQAEEIRSLYGPRTGKDRKGRHSQASLAKMFGVSPSCIQGVIEGKRWGSVS